MKRTIMILAILSLCWMGTSGYAGPAKGESGLPPGLQKQQARGKELPPGWQKKIKQGEVLDKEVYAEGKVVVPLGEDGSITIELDGKRLRVNAETRTILDILD